MKRRSKAPHQTAITRKKLSLPAQYLLQRDLLKGDVLDYGCGRGDDVRRLGQALGVHDWSPVVGYDPHWRPNMPTKKFDTIMCNYVLNVIIDPIQREEVLLHITSLLKPGGTAFITVRRDITKGTASQCVVILDEETLVHAKGKFETYRIIV